MPILPKEETEGVRTQSQRQQETEQRRFGGAMPQTSEGQPPATEAGTSVAPASAAPDSGALMVMLQEQARRPFGRVAAARTEGTGSSFGRAATGRTRGTDPSVGRADAPHEGPSRYLREGDKGGEG
ncbi:unnamed protein product [Parnassius apollo]|uniref:(apollo) hypothetical protein n=1 Tax=Parnassius apollo TaxID=110799 RepID=A0A8S3Y219_PARAO|nr:unnamed protein product [Parnassius apollo]